MTTKLCGGDKRLYTAAEARRIDIERGGTGRIIKPSDYDQNWHLFFHEETRTWRICENQGGQLQHGIYDSPFCLVKEIWSALTPEQKPIVLDYLVLVDANERIKQLEKENESLLAERNRLREWYEDYYTKQPTIEQLEKELAELKKERDNDIHYRLYSSMQKERDEYKNNYHEILADHGELTRKFDELKELHYTTPEYGVTIDRNINMLSIRHQNRTCTRHIENWVELSAGAGKPWNDCWEKSPSTTFSVILRDDEERIIGRAAKLEESDGYSLFIGESTITLNRQSMKNWSWKYEADL